MLNHKTLLLSIFLSLATQCKSRQFAGSFLSKEIIDEPPHKASAGGSPALVPGTYIGFVKVANTNSKLPLTWEIIEEQGLGKRQYRVIAKTYWGNFYSQDYHADYYANVSFNTKSRELVFLTKTKSLFPRNVKLRGDAILTGTLQSNSDPKDQLEFKAIYSGARKNIDLDKQLAIIYPKQSLVLPIQGTFAGQCGDKNTVVQLETSRWYSPTPMGNEHLRFVRIVGRLALQDSLLCGNSDVTCTRFNFQAGSYNLFSGQLDLFEREQKKSCQYQANAIACDGCNLQRKSSEQDFTLANYKPLKKRDQRLEKNAKADFSGAPLNADNLSGEYYGYIFHEQTEIYQLLRLKVTTEKNLDFNQPRTQKISAVATLFFGDQNSKEFVVYKFNPIPIIKDNLLVTLDGKGEGFMQVGGWDKQQIKGIWYGKTFGRVGTLELQKNTIPPLADDSRRMPSITGTYTSAKAKLNILATAEISDNEELFFPLRVKGICNDLSGNDRRRTISEVSYDFYSGNVAIQLDDGRIAYGHTTDKGIALQWPTATKLGAVVADVKEKDFFEYRPEEFSGSTAKKMFELFKDGVTGPKYFY